MNMRQVVVSFVSASFLLAAGCGGSDETSGLAGVYKVSAQTKIRNACEGAGETEAIDPPFFLIVDDPLLNGLHLNVYRCTSADRASCDEMGFPLVFLAQRAGSEFIAEQLQRSGGGADPCFVQWTGTRIIKTAAGVQLRTENRSADRPAAECAARDPAISSGRGYPCTVVDVRDAAPAQ